ncbi:regulator of chromosome condensation 1/beta-lactamase-inhibitor protein II [Delphinella strobiligena]|nr:regulator of chromosome condensation 1/beta-lactamase-inhibitor protein II [Delphinella strobiligena]
MERDSVSQHILIRAGGAQIGRTAITCREQPRPTFTQGFGDYDGMKGALDDQGRVYLMSDSELVLFSSSETPPIAYIALAGNGRVAISFIQASSAQLAHVDEFISFDEFKAWCACTGSERPRHSHLHRLHVFRGPVKQLVANATTFACLNSRGEVFTWGDARHRSLGRATTGEGAVSAVDAVIVEALGGIKIEKISAGGWITAALSEDGAAYLWGTGTPGMDECMRVLKDLDPSEVALLDIPGDDGEPVDIQDVTMGDGHVLLLTEGGKIFSAGENKNGQLGIGKEHQYAVDWKEVKIGESLQCSSVRAGPKSVFIKANQMGR